MSGGELGAALERIETMEASRFWKLRNRWHALKRRFRLSNGELPSFRQWAAAAFSAAPSGNPYATWREQNTPRAADVERMREAARVFAYRPLLSIVMPVYDAPEPFLRAALDSVLAQAYDNWEICCADDASPSEHVRDILADYHERESRIRPIHLAVNGGISAATNAALDRARGSFVVFMDHDDMLAPDALYEIVLALNADRDIDVLYSDEDKLDEGGNRCDPHFKADWCPESFLSRMYVGHLVACRRDLVATVGGLRSGFDGSQDYDLLLRVTERTDRVHHIPKVLYHWRMHRGSTAADAAAKPYAQDAALRAIAEALDRRGEDGRVSHVPDAPNTYSVRFAIRRPDRVSIIVPTRDHGDDVRRCVEAAFARTAYQDVELLLIDNGSRDPESLRVFAELARADRRIRLIEHDVPFNFSEINNFAVGEASGRYLLFLNNDTVALSDGWVEAMVEYAQRPPIAAVGGLLLYPDRTVQHAGVVVGLGGVASHSHKHFPADAPGYYYMLRSINNYSAVTAAAMMVRREIFESAGGFDESLAVAFNDVDLCLRFREAGLRNVYLPHVILYHHESKSRGIDSAPEDAKRFAGEIAWMKRRWPLDRPDPCYNRNLTLDREDFSLRI